VSDRFWYLAIGLAGSILVAATASAQPTGFVLVTPDQLKWNDAGSLPPGAKMAVLEGKMNEAGPITARIKLPANYRVPPHWHPGVERLTVLSGTFNYGMGEKFDANATKALAAGSVVVMPPKMNHFAWTEAETVLQLNVDGPWVIVYVNPADDPRKK